MIKKNLTSMLFVLLLNTITVFLLSWYAEIMLHPKMVEVLNNRFKNQIDSIFAV